MRGLFPENPFSGEAINQDDATIRRTAEMAVSSVIRVEAVATEPPATLEAEDCPTLIIL